MRVDLFDFDLPEDRIALRPASPRESARLLHIDPANDRSLSDRRVSDLPRLLRSGDLINVPLLDDNKVFTFGEIQTGEIALTDVRKTLVEVLAEAGGIDRIRADARGIFVFRREDLTQRGFTVYQFDLSSAATLVTASEFGMAPLDIVFVTNDPATRWADTIGTVVRPFDSLLSARTTAQSLTN